MDKFEIEYEYLEGREVEFGWFEVFAQDKNHAIDLYITEIQKQPTQYDHCILSLWVTSEGKLSRLYPVQQ